MPSTEHIWASFNKQLFAFIKHNLKDDASSRDVLQDVFLKIHLKKSTLQQEHKLSSWVWQITRNTLLDHIKTRKNLTELSETLSAPENESNFNIEFAPCLRPFALQLPADDREAILRVDFEGMPQKEFAKKEGLTYSAAKSRVQRARLRLKELFIGCCRMPADRYGNILDVIPGKNCTCHRRPSPTGVVSSV